MTGAPISLAQMIEALGIGAALLFALAIWANFHVNARGRHDDEGGG